MPPSSSASSSLEPGQRKPSTPFQAYGLAIGVRMEYCRPQSPVWNSVGASQVWYAEETRRGDYDDTTASGALALQTERRGESRMGAGRQPMERRVGAHGLQRRDGRFGRAGPFGRLAGRLALQKKEVGSVLARSRCPFGPRNDTTPFATWDTAWSRLVGLGSGFSQNPRFRKTNPSLCKPAWKFLPGKAKNEAKLEGGELCF